MTCAKQMGKQIFIMFTYVNMNMKITWQSYDAKSWLNLMLNKLKEMRGHVSIYPPFGPNSK
jgi:hypothetical protein